MDRQQSDRMADCQRIEIMTFRSPLVLQRHGATALAAIPPDELKRWAPEHHYYALPYPPTPASRSAAIRCAIIGLNSQSVSQTQRLTA